MQARITYYIGFCLGCSKVNSYTSSSTCAAAAPPSLRYHIMRVALPHALFLPCCCPLPSAENFKSSFAFCVYSHLYYIFLLLLLLLLLRFSCFLVFFFLPLPCFSLILHPRRDAKWAITARFDCGPDVLNGSDVRIAIAIRHSPLALPNPKVHAKQQQQRQPLKLPFPHSLQYGVPSPHTHSTVRSIVNHLKENREREREKPPNAHRCEIALGQQRVFVRIRVHIPLPFRVFGSVRFGGFFLLVLFGCVPP